MKKYTVFVIEDLLSVLLNIKGYIDRIPWLGYLGGDTDPIGALEKIKTRQVRPDIIILDVEMPGMTGIELARELKEFSDARVIFSSAYDKYAVEAIKLDAIDYLVKPYDYEQFLTAILKLDEGINKDVASAHPITFEFFKIDKGFTKIHFKNIISVTAKRNYVEVYMKAGREMLHTTLAGLMAMLPQDIFCQVHRSHIVNLNRVVQFNATEIQLDMGGKIPLGEKFRSSFNQQIQALTSRQHRGLIH